MNGVNFDWGATESRIERDVRLIISFEKVNSHLDIPVDYMMEGIKLGPEVALIRRRYKKGTLEESAVIKLNEVGFVWDPAWKKIEDRIVLLKQFVKIKGHCRIPTNYEIGGVPLGSWSSRIRAQYHNCELGEKIVNELNAIGFAWNAPREEGLIAIEKFYVENGHSKIRSDVEIAGFRLGALCTTIRKERKAGKLDSAVIERLDMINFDWDPGETRKKHMLLLTKNYYEEHKNINMPAQYEVDGCKVGGWLCEIRRKKREGGEIEGWIENYLNSIGFRWLNVHLKECEEV